MSYRHTKIVATVGPSCESEEMLTALMNAGTDVFRLNFSHGEQAQKREIIQRIRKVSVDMKRAVAILGDLQGPKIRVGLLDVSSSPRTMERFPGLEAPAYLLFYRGKKLFHRPGLWQADDLQELIDVALSREGF